MSNFPLHVARRHFVCVTAAQYLAFLLHGKQRCRQFIGSLGLDSGSGIGSIATCRVSIPRVIAVF